WARRLRSNSAFVAAAGSTGAPPWAGAEAGCACAAAGACAAGASTACCAWATERLPSRAAARRERACDLLILVSCNACFWKLQLRPALAPGLCENELKRSGPAVVNARLQ